MVSNREKSNIAIAILENKQFDSVPNSIFCNLSAPITFFWIYEKGSETNILLL